MYLLPCGRTYIPLYDYRGSARLLLNPDGTPDSIYRYSAYGQEQTDPAITPWRFCSKRVDPELGWTFFGRRHYDPEIGRFTTADPLMFVDGPKSVSANFDQVI